MEYFFLCLRIIFQECIAFGLFQELELHPVLTLQFPSTLYSEVYHTLLYMEHLIVIGFDSA